MFLWGGKSYGKSMGAELKEFKGFSRRSATYMKISSDIDNRKSEHERFKNLNLVFINIYFFFRWNVVSENDLKRFASKPREVLRIKEFSL